IEQVLPGFHQFANETVLVGHNVAFDMLMLQLKEESAHIRFSNPILDTMLLSDIVHPAHRGHGLQAVADRLGVRIMGRHTALGDAMATAEIFLKLIPLLAAQGIRTMKEARLASQKSLYARLKY
ncbi:MAG: exonuclease domain-containing protein, partial [Desulfatitalea sp.]